MGITLRGLMKTRTFRAAVIITAAVVIILIIANFWTGAEPDKIRAFISEKGADALAIKDWMCEKDLNAIILLNKSNRMSGSGVSVQTGRLYCYFGGPGAGKLISPSSDIEQMSEPFSKALYLEKIAKQYGAYEYVIKDDSFEVALCRDPYNRLAGAEGTLVYYSETPPVPSAEDLGNGWFTAKTNVESRRFVIPLEAWALLGALAVYLIFASLFRKYECTATVQAKKAEYAGRRPRIVNQIRGAYVYRFDGFNAYLVTFVTDGGEKLELYVRRGDYGNIDEGMRGRLIYRRLGNMLRFIDFRPDIENG